MQADTLGQLNPLRYRGYVYDSETELYYLQSRYNDPEMGRFMNADILYYILKDLDHHKGAVWKLFNQAGQRIASLASDGRIVGK